MAPTIPPTADDTAALERSRALRARDEQAIDRLIERSLTERGLVVGAYSGPRAAILDARADESDGRAWWGATERGTWTIRLV